MTTPNTIFLDIETGPLPVSRREFLRPSPDTIKTGNLKDPAKIAAKVAGGVASTVVTSDSVCNWIP